MEKKYKMVKFRLSSWNRLRRQFYGRKDETLSDYIDRVTLALQFKKDYQQAIKSRVSKYGNKL